MAQAVPDETIQALTNQMDEMKLSVDSLEKERDFYFSKVSTALCTQSALIFDVYAHHHTTFNVPAPRH